MCLGGGGQRYDPPKPPAPILPGPPSPQDKVNDMEVENINDRSQQKVQRNKNKASVATSQSGKQTNKAY